MDEIQMYIAGDSIKSECFGCIGIHLLPTGLLDSTTLLRKMLPPQIVWTNCLHEAYQQFSIELDIIQIQSSLFIVETASSYCHCRNCFVLLSIYCGKLEFYALVAT